MVRKGLILLIWGQNGAGQWVTGARDGWKRAGASGGDVCAHSGNATGVPQGRGIRINGSSILQANCISERFLELNDTRRWVIYGVNCKKTAAQRYGRGNKLKPSVTKPIPGKGGVERWKQGRGYLFSDEV